MYPKDSVQDRKLIFNSSSNEAVKSKADSYSRHSDIYSSGPWAWLSSLLASNRLGSPLYFLENLRHLLDSGFESDCKERQIPLLPDALIQPQRAFIHSRLHNRSTGNVPSPFLPALMRTKRRSDMSQVFSGTPNLAATKMNGIGHTLYCSCLKVAESCHCIYCHGL